MRTAWIISAAAHVAVLGFGLVTLASSQSNEDKTDFMPVTLVTADDTSRATHGQLNAPKPLDNPKPLADKIADPKPVAELAPKVADKPEIKTDAAAAPPPKPEAKPERKAAEKPKDKPKTDPIAEALKKDETKKPPKKPPEFKPDDIAEQLKKSDAKKPPSEFNADRVAALLDKREPQRQVAAAESLNNAAALGAPNTHAVQLSQSELGALKARLSECWNPPPGVDATSKLFVVLHVLFKPDGSLASEPAVVESSESALGLALAESAKRALLGCQPFTMLRPEHYDAWKDVSIGFNPHEMLGQ